MYRVRQWLETPFLDRPFLTWILVLVLLPVSFLMGAVALLRRQFLFPYFRKKKHAFRVVCVGNMAMGGTGKSPVVRHLATLLQDEGYAVAIVSRGYGSVSKSPVIVTKTRQDSVVALNDENREHWFRLIEHEKSDDLILCQNANRQEAFGSVHCYWSQRRVPVERQIVLLDDGMQNLKTPRDVDVCVWPESARRAPALCFPVGPYREVFFRSMSKDVLFHFFSSDSLADSLKKRFQLGFDNRNAVVVTKTQSFYRITPLSSVSSQNHIPKLVLSYRSESQLRAEINQDIPIVCAAGISRPDEFFSSIQNLFPKVAAQLVAFADHGGLASDVVLSVAKNAQKISVFTTEKDFSRWCLDPVFYDTICKNQQAWYVVRLDISFHTLASQPFMPTALFNEA